MPKKITSIIFVLPLLLSIFLGVAFSNVKTAQADYSGQDMAYVHMCECRGQELSVLFGTDSEALLGVFCSWDCGACPELAEWVATLLAMTGTDNLGILLAQDNLSLAIPYSIFHIQSTSTSSDNSDLERQLETEINDMLVGIDLSELENYLNQLEAAQRELFDNQSFGAMVRRILNGDNSVDYDSFISFVIGLIFGQIGIYVPLAISIVAIALTMSILSSIKGKFASKSVENVAHFASLSIVIILVTTNVVILMGRTVRIINGLQTQMNIVFPILLTLMTTVGATNSVAVYQPSVLILSSWIINLITIAVLPTFIFSFVFAAVGSLSKDHPLGKLSDFFASVCKWILGVVFFLFLAFLSVQGVTAGIYDGVSIRTARFAISRYVPIIGGYLSEGFNLMLAGGVLIKNAVGLGAVILLIVSILPTLINIIVFSLALKLTAALCEPLGDSRIPKYLNSVSKHVTILAAILLGVAFLYFIFLMLIIFTGNMIL